MGARGGLELEGGAGPPLSLVPGLSRRSQHACGSVEHVFDPPSSIPRLTTTQPVTHRTPALHAPAVHTPAPPRRAPGPHTCSCSRADLSSSCVTFRSFLQWVRAPDRAGMSLLRCAPKALLTIQPASQPASAPAPAPPTAPSPSSSSTNLPWAAPRGTPHPPTHTPPTTSHRHLHRALQPQRRLLHAAVGGLHVAGRRPQRLHALRLACGAARQRSWREGRWWAWRL